MGAECWPGDMAIYDEPAPAADSGICCPGDIDIYDLSYMIVSGLGLLC
jgi:hypothetical protein